ncbi:hypothetical protein HMPREF1624_04990 [Sporothrix schenckii ATCC 58251]|uniref:Uncharacterized protein n=1 Tax=Sporothrix schenckii (strain ATCC 58251 / de Perez 2211183) TaxID=1391915 RepID=U7PRI7_SPOS1|nr:hypothetical protein HMPREF1624_04990 [Sporothrix schenckii ATCC 58251]
MAHQGSFSSAHSSIGSSSPASSTSAASVTAASPTTVSFSVFQEGPGRPLVFAPPLGTPELQALVDLFIALDVPVSMKMEMIQRDFEAHTARTNERYKTYFVPSASSTPTASALVHSPSTYTASPSPIFHNVFDTNFNHPASTGSGSGSGSLYLDASPAPRPSPTESDLTVASDSLFPLSVPMFSAPQFADVNAAFAGNFFPVAVDQSPVALTAASMWPVATLTATAAPAARRTQPRQSAAPPPSQRRRLSGSSSMQILTRTGEDVTHVSSRGTRTHEERENTRLVRQRGACPDCRRKKTRCNPDHAGFTAEHVSARAGPYAAPAQSGRAKAEAAAARAAKASKAKVDGKKTVTTSEPVFAAPQQAPNATVLAGIEDGGGGGVGHIPPLDLDVFSDSFDWEQLAADQGRLFTEDDLELSIATTLSMTMPTTTSGATAAASASSSSTATTQAPIDPHSVPPFRPPPPYRPTDAHLQSSRNMNAPSTTASPVSAIASASPADQAPQMGRMISPAVDFNDGFAGPAAFANDNSAVFGDASETFFSAVNASMTGSCVQPGSAQTGGLTHAGPLRTSGSLPAGVDLGQIDLGDDDGRELDRLDTGVTHPEDEERERGRPTEFTRRGVNIPDRDRFTPFGNRSEQSWSTLTGETSCGPRSTTTSAQATATVTPPILKTIRGSPSSAEAGVPPSDSLSTSQAEPTPSSSTPPLSPADTTVLLTVIANFTASLLLPAYLAWTAAAAAEAEAHDSLVSDLEVQLDRMNLAPTLVACQ